MKAADLPHRLTSFGIDADESVLYYHLSRLGVARVGEIARAAGMARPRAYDGMRALEEHGLAERTMQRPASFRPLPIQDALERLLAVNEKRLTDMRESQIELQKQWPRPASICSTRPTRVPYEKETV